MGLISQVSIDVPIKSSAEKFYGFFRNKMNLLVELFPLKLQSFEFLEGNDCTTGSLIHCSYDIVGPTELKARVVDVNEENKSITYEVVEGDILSQYTLFRPKFRASNNGIIGGATVNWSIEFEKADQNVPSPQVYMDFVSLISIGLDAYLIANQVITLPGL